MDIGIGLPNSLIGVDGPELVDWARRAEDRGFASLGTIGRVAYDTHEELVALAAAAGATERIGLMTTVLVGPPRDPVLLAKQAATLDAVSGGRFRLGLGIGGRDDDYRALGEEPEQRGDRLEQVVETCRSIWRGEPPAGIEASVGPEPVEIPILVGGFSPPAFRRAGRMGDGFLAGPIPPGAVSEAHATVADAARQAERPVPPLYAARYVAIGDDVREEADRNVEAYYGFAGDEMVENTKSAVLRSEDDVRSTLDALGGLDATETVLWPLTRSFDQITRIAAAAGL